MIREIKVTKEQAFIIACGHLREQVDKETYGSFTVNLEKGRATWVKADFRINLPVDLEDKSI